MIFFLKLTFFILTKQAEIYIIKLTYGDLAQLVEHTAHIRDVNGSIPLVAIKDHKDFNLCGLFLCFFQLY